MKNVTSVVTTLSNIYGGAFFVKTRFEKVKAVHYFRKKLHNRCFKVSHIRLWIHLQTLTQVFFCEFCETFKNTFLYRTLKVAAYR